MKKYFIALLMILNPLQSYAGGEAMFGLTFGMTVDEVRSLIPTMVLNNSDDIISVYNVTDPKEMPRHLSIIEKYSLVFVGDKLLKIGAYGFEINNDSYGIEGKSIFKKIYSGLNEKYGKPSLERQTFGNKIWTKSDEFYQCLAYDGCGNWFSVYEVKGKGIILTLNGLSRGKGFISLTVESVPEWSDALKIKNKNKDIKDKNAL
jgi:hypothetical protein